MLECSLWSAASGTQSQQRMVGSTLLRMKMADPPAFAVINEGTKHPTLSVLVPEGLVEIRLSHAFLEGM